MIKYSPISIFGMILSFTYLVVLISGTTVGLGAVCITNFGTKDADVASSPVLVMPSGVGSSGANGLIYCRTCGKQVAAKAVMCPGCGARPLDGISYCYNCGNPTGPNAMVCVKCGVTASCIINHQKDFAAALGYGG